jgi:hypothetical protein
VVGWRKGSEHVVSACLFVSVCVGLSMCGYWYPLLRVVQ